MATVIQRDATPLDWTGDPIDVKNRFPSLGHGEDDYKMMLQHFVGYEDVVGDQPLAHGRYPAAWWGSLGGQPGQDETVNFAWTEADRDRVTYAVWTG